MLEDRTPEDSRVGLNWHVEFIAGLARLLRPEVYVELGICQAELFNKVAPYVSQAIGVDVDPASAGYVQEAPNVRFVCGTTDAFAAESGRLGLQIDLLFVDADHSRESVLRDFRNYLPFVRPHGLILLHDTHPGDVSLLEPGWCDDAYLAVEELQRGAVGYEMMTVPLSPGLTMCRKRTRQLAWMEPPAVEGEERAASAPRDDASRFRIVCIVQVFNEIRKGNLERFFEHVTPLVDAVVAYDDGSTDGTYEYLLARTPHVIRSARNDFTDEVRHKQILLDAALRLDPDFILLLDADEVLTAGAAERLPTLCERCVAEAIDGVAMHMVNVWRDHAHQRVDHPFDELWKVCLWRVVPGIGYASCVKGLHQDQHPPSIQRVERAQDIGILHYGFADECNLAHKYLTYRAQGQRGYDMLDRLIDEERLELRRIPEDWIPASLIREIPTSRPRDLATALACVNGLRSAVLRPGFSIVCPVYKSVEWTRFCYEQVLRYTDMSDKELLFVANDATDEVLEYLRASYIPHVEWNNTEEQRAEWYINNVYRAYNFGAREARGDVLVFINDDMGFSPGWLEALWEAYDGSSSVASRSVESGKLSSGEYGIEMDFGMTPSEYREQDFLEFAEGVREPTVLDGGLYMPLLVRRDVFLSVGGYPEGNIRPGSDIFDPEMAVFGEPCISGDNVMFQRLQSRGIRRRTACDSVVYHVQMGEKDGPDDEGGAAVATPLVAVVDGPAGSMTSGTGLWGALRDHLPQAVGVDGLAEAADAAVVIQDASSAVAVDPEQYTIAYLRDAHRAAGEDSTQQERNLRAARFAVTDSLRMAMSYPDYDFEIIPAGAGTDADVEDSSARWRALLERAMQEVTVERIGFVRPQTVDEGAGMAQRERPPRRSVYAPLPQAPLPPEPDAEHAAGLLMEEQAVRLRRRVEKAVGPRLADPTLRAIHAVSWTIRPVRHRLARRRTRSTADR